MQALGSEHATRHQRLVDSHFREAAPYWADIYERDDDVDAAIYRRRLRTVLDLVQQIALPERSRVLEIGSGAGYATLALARGGHKVDAIDAIETMVEATRDRVAGAGLAASVNCRLGDIHALDFPDGAFGLVVAMGVLPWLPSIERPLREMSRVLRPSGYALVTVDNRWGLRQVLEPYTCPLLRPAKQAVKTVLAPFRQRKIRSLTHSISIKRCEASFRAAGLDKVLGVTIGFGPFTIFNHAAIPAGIGMMLHRYLQALADRGVRGLRSAGSQYVILARKRETP
jgi:SAM-dependent methyltransferase